MPPIQIDHIVPSSNAIARHILKPPDSLSKRNSKRSRKIVTAPRCAKKLEKCHVKHFPLILTQAFRPYLPADTDHVKEIGNSADRAPFTIPDCRRFSCRRRQPYFFDYNNNFGNTPTKVASLLSKYEQIWQSNQNSRHGALNTKSATTNSTHGILPKAEQNR